ncbi:MAG: flagellar biosynthetic protein FliQ [Gemmatimonadetes bacterium]|nr:flagellar biosynthetic protein FliQ [Gemmatimonadota bacterium]
MTEGVLIDVIREAAMQILMVGGPILISGLIVGLGIGLLQTVTQIQEATIAFIPKMVLVVLVFILVLPYMMARMTAFATTLMGDFRPFIQ